MNKTNVRYQGACRTGPQCNSNSDCTTGSTFCFKRKGCVGRATCIPKPVSCLPENSAVCGCDGKTYGSKCKAAMNGTSVKTSGPCKGSTPPPGSKGCTSDSDCSTDQFCLFPTGQCSGSGQCFKAVRGGDFCPKDPAAVCGCDGKTYLNACKARSNRVNVKSRGACKSPSSPSMMMMGMTFSDQEEEEATEDVVEDVMEDLMAEYDAVAEVHVIAEYEDDAEVDVAEYEDNAEGSIVADDYQAAAEEFVDE